MIKVLGRWFENISLRKKLIFSYCLIILLITAFVLLYFPQRHKATVYKEMNQRITTLARTLSQAYGLARSKMLYQAVKDAGDIVRADPNFGYILILNQKGVTFQQIPEDINVVMDPGLPISTPTIDKDYIRIKTPIHYGENFYGYVILGMKLSGLKKDIAEINRTSYWTLGILLAIGVLISLFMSDLINTPIIKLMESVNRIISHGDYSERVNSTRRDEAGILAARFDEMVARIETRDYELNQQFQELQAVNKLRDEFLAATTHDLRSPITAILGFADLIDMNDKLDPGDRKRVAYIKRSAQFLANLVEDVLDISRLESGKTVLKLKPISLKAVIDSSVETITYMALPKEITIRFMDQTHHNIIINGDHDALLRIMNNLLSNAVKFTPNGGDIRVNLSANAHRAEVAVKDTGIGIPEDKIPLLFRMYTSVSRSGTAGEKGTGLGLSITKNLVEKHNGTITVHSKVDEGTTFTLSFPLLTEKPGKN